MAAAELGAWRRAYPLGQADAGSGGWSHVPVPLQASAVQTSPSSLQTLPAGSNWHPALQQSPLAEFPSSHCSPGSITPLPHSRLGVLVDDGVARAVAVAEGEGVPVAVWVGVGRGDSEGEGVGVGVGVGVEVEVEVKVKVGVGEWVGVVFGVSVGTFAAVFVGVREGVSLAGSDVAVAVVVGESVCVSVGAGVGVWVGG